MAALRASWLRRSWIAPLALALATSGWMLAVEGRQGISRDESQYFRAGEHYWASRDTPSRNPWSTASGATTTSTRP